MKLIIAVVTLVSLVGCVSLLPDPTHDKSSAQYRQCEYEAALATPTTANPWDDLGRRSGLIDMCMARRR